MSRRLSWQSTRKGNDVRTKFTPGPWEIRHNHPDARTAPDLAYIVPASAPAYYEPCAEVAYVYGCTYNEKSTPNAALIADAPAMYKFIAGLVMRHGLLQEQDHQKAKALLARHQS